MGEKNELKHVGVIMDGNRRWAKKKGFSSVLKGHEIGVQQFMNCCTWCLKAEIPYLSVYAFSTENWNRTPAEIKGLFKIMEQFFNSEIENCIKKGIRIKVVGDRTLLDEKDIGIIESAENRTKNCSKLLVQIAISYGGRNEITRAFKRIGSEIKENQIDSENISEEMISEYLDTAGTPMIDLVIRTGGNHRLSNFFIWQAAYSEIYFTDTLWPEFSEEEFQDIISDYRNVKINFGK